MEQKRFYKTDEIHVLHRKICGLKNLSVTEHTYLE